MKIYEADKKKIFSLLAACLLLTVFAAVGSSLAYLVSYTPEIVNKFIVPTNGLQVASEIEDNVNKSVTIQNTGEVKSFIRAKVIFTWKDENGNVYPAEVAETDYNITWNTTDWSVNEGYYYYNSALEAAGETAPLFTDCSPAADAPETGYTLHVEVLSQSIQAEPTTVADAAWGYVPGNN